MTLPPENDNADDPDRDDAADQFDLSTPTGNIDVQPDAIESEQPRAAENAGSPEPTDSDESYGAGGWKGVEELVDEEDDDPPMAFGSKEPIEEDELDMTPMVDVTFLLLIFFMVTASFTLQKSIPQPPAASDAPSTNVAEEEEEQQDYVEVIIDQNNSFYVTTRDSQEIEAPSETEMRRLVKDAKDTYGPERIVIMAHVDALHEKLIAVCDAGQASSLKIEVKTTDIEF